MDLDSLDAEIQKRIKASDLNIKIMDENIQHLKDDLKDHQEFTFKNKESAKALAQVGTQEMKDLALMVLSRTQNLGHLTSRRKEYFGSSGQQQNLLYRQIWLPFTDSHYGNHHCL